MKKLKKYEVRIVLLDYVWAKDPEDAALLADNLSISEMESDTQIMEITH